MANERSGMDGTSIDWSYAASQAYLPPRSPLFAGGGGASSNQDNNSFFSNWPKLPHPGPNRRHQRTPSTSFLPQTPAWVDDLLNDTPDVPPIKSNHRRSSSDSIAFLEAPLQHVQIKNIAAEGELDSRHVEARLSGGSRGLDKLDEEPISSRFTESGLLQKQQTAHAMLNPHHSTSAERRTPLDTSSAPSDHDSANASSLDEKRAWGSGQAKNDSEVQSALGEHTLLPGAKGETSTITDSPLDPKRAKRILANRQSAQRSRVRKLQYIAELERTVNVLQEEVSALSPQVTYLDRHRIILNVDNSAMKQRIAALAQEKLFKDAHNDALKTEVHRLRQLYQQQQQKQGQQQSIPRQVGQQQQFDLSMSSQLELKDHDIVGGSDVSHCVDDMYKDNEVDLPKGSSTRTPPLMKPIGPSSCCNMTSDKGKDVHMHNMPGLAQLHSDFRVQNP